MAEQRKLRQKGTRRSFVDTRTCRPDAGGRDLKLTDIQTQKSHMKLQFIRNQNQTRSISPSPPPRSASAAGPALAPTIQTHNPTTEMATAAAVQADDAETVTKTGDKSPPNVLGWVWVNASSDTDDASENFESSIHESPSASDVRSPTITLTNRQELELPDGLGFADTKGSYVFEACIISVSFMLILSSPLLLRRLYIEPLDLLRAIATFISAYILFLIFIFSPKTCLSTVFFHMPCAVCWPLPLTGLLALMLDSWSEHMATGWLVGLLGCAYVEHLQHIGQEKTAKHITPLTDKDERFFKRLDRGAIFAGFGLISLVLVIVRALPLWFIPMDALSVSVAFLSVMAGGAMFSLVAFVARFVLYDALLSADHIGDIMLCYICPCVAIGYFVLLLSHLCFTSDTIGATFLWCLMLSIAGLLGYELSVHAQCKHMMLSRQQLEQRDGLGSDTKIPSDSDIGSATITLVSRCGDGSSYVFEACMVSVSFLLVLSSPVQLHHLYSEPLALMRSIAAFISAYIIFLIFIFSPRMCVSTVFFHMPCLVVVVIVVDRLVDPYAGFLVMHMVTGWLASLLGYAYGQLMQHIGRKMTATPLALTEEDKRTFKEARGPAAAAFGLLSLLMVTAGALPLWFFPEDAFSVSVAFLTVMEGGAVLCWVVFVARFMLFDALFSPGQLGYITLCYIFPNVVIGYLVLVLSYFYLTTDTIGAMFLWCLMLFIAGLLGYELSVHAQYNQTMLSR